MMGLQAIRRSPKGLRNRLRAVLEAQRKHHELMERTAILGEATVRPHIAIYMALGGGSELFMERPPLLPTQPALVAAVRRLTNGWL
jgi:hypothetical protein